MSDVVREDRISALETRVAALEAAGSPVDLSLPEPESTADEKEPKRWFANQYPTRFGALYANKEDAESVKGICQIGRLELVEADAYDRLKAERDELQKQLAQSAIEYSGLVDELTSVTAERDRLKSQMLRFSEGKDISNPVWYAKNCLLASAVDQIKAERDEAVQEPAHDRTWVEETKALLYGELLDGVKNLKDGVKNLKAERDVLREFVEAVAEGRSDEWDKRHGLHGISWNASARHCLRDADEAKQGK